MHSIPYARQSISEQDIQAVVEVLRSDWLTQGPTVERFERAVAEYCGCKHAVAVNSATSALHLACLVAGLKKGDALWTSPITFVASANCGIYCGADVDFVDIDQRSYTISMEALEIKLKEAQRRNRLPAVLVPVHFAGQSCEMARVAEMAQHYGISVIEDASHAIGGRYRTFPVGACTFSDMTVFSFHPVKIITTGEGGMIVTNRSDLAEHLYLLRSHGITRDTGKMHEPSAGPWYYEQVDLGYNYRMTDIQAALGLSQMARLDAFVSRRHHLVQRYNSAFADLPVTLPWQYPDAFSAHHLYVLRLRSDHMRKSRLQVFEEIRQQGIQVNLHYIPVHTQPYYRQLGFSWGDFPEAERYYAEAISLPLYYELAEQDQDRVIDVFRNAII